MLLFAGHIPTELGQLTALKRLFLHHNNFIGSASFTSPRPAASAGAEYYCFFCSDPAEFASFMQLKNPKCNVDWE